MQERKQLKESCDDRKCAAGTVLTLKGFPKNSKGLVYYIKTQKLIFNLRRLDDCTIVKRTKSKKH